MSRDVVALVVRVRFCASHDAPFKVLIPNTHVRQPRPRFLRICKAVQPSPRPTQVAAAREGECQGAAGVAVAELAQVVGRAFQHRIMLELVVAQRRHDRSQAGRARRALAAAAHYVLLAVQFYVIQDSCMQRSEVPDLLFRRCSTPFFTPSVRPLQLHTLETRQRARVKAAATLS